MIVEVRSYRIKPGRREEFIRFFETRSIPALRAHGMKIVGPFLDLENPNKFVWLRSFPSLEERERMKKDFYEGAMEERAGGHRHAHAGKLRRHPLRESARLRV
jgi:hypothetical protein